MAARTLLNQLRLRANVDCDTLDEDIAKSLGPFADATSNQVIALNELKKQRHVQRLKDAAKLAAEVLPKYSDVALVELAVEIVVKLFLIEGCLNASTLKGFSEDDYARTEHDSTSPRIRPCPDRPGVRKFNGEDGRECSA